MTDNNLSWHDHIEYIAGKISKNINILIKVKSFLKCCSLISLYYALVYPYLISGSILWGNNYEAPLASIVRLQNKVIRIINDVPLRDHIIPHYAQLGILKFPDIVKLYTCKFLYEHLCDFKSTNLDLSYVFEQYNYNTRSAELQHLNVAPFRTNIRKFCPHVIGCYFWNSIPLVIRQKRSMHSFKQSLYCYYLAQY